MIICHGTSWKMFQNKPPYFPVTHMTSPEKRETYGPKVIFVLWECHGKALEFLKNTLILNIDLELIYKMFALPSM